MKTLNKILWTVILVAGIVAIYNQFSKRSNETTTPTDQQQEDRVTGDANVQLIPLGDSWIRTDGDYYHNVEDLHYYIRFYPEGNATLVYGPEKEGGVSLRTLMAQNTPSGENSIHNVPVTVQGDSLFMITTSMKGNIEYRGAKAAEDGSAIQFLKHSKINGKKALITYKFLPKETS